MNHFILNKLVTVPGKINLSPLYDLLKVLAVPFILSFLGNIWVNTLAFIGSMIIIYSVYRTRQAQLFELSKTEATLLVQMPMYLLLSVWGIALYAVDEQTARVGLLLISEMVFLLFVTLLPLYRKNKNWGIKTRRFSYKNMYLGTCIILLTNRLAVLFNL